MEPDGEGRCKCLMVMVAESTPKVCVGNSGLCFRFVTLKEWKVTSLTLNPASCLSV